MRDWNAYRARFVRDRVPIRLGGVSANLARIRSASENNSHFDLVRNMLHDSEYLIEWTAPELDAEVASELVEMQIQLAVWRLRWQTIWNDLEQRQAVAEQAGKWSDRILDLSGLLNVT